MISMSPQDFLTWAGGAALVGIAIYFIVPVLVILIMLGIFIWIMRSRNNGMF
jgi:hypothetical protein